MKHHDLAPFDYYNMVKPYIPENVISSRNYRDILITVSHFPKGISSYLGFETELTKKAPTNILFAVSYKREERENFIKCRDKLLNKFSYNDTWTQIFEFLEKWRNFHNKVLGIWFEFDADTLSRDIPIPNFFMHLNPINKNNSSSIKDIAHLLPTIHPLNRFEENLTRCAEVLPENASIFQIGTMLNRRTEGIRIAVKGIEGKNIPPYLESIGYDMGRKEDMIEELSYHITRFVLSFDVLEDGIGNKMGIECGFYPNSQYFAIEYRWKKFLNYLVNKNLCRKDLRDFLAQYEGLIDASNLTEEMMGKLKPVTKFSGDYIGIIANQIGHIKISIDSEGEEAKAYYGVRLWGYKEEWK